MTKTRRAVRTDRVKEKKAAFIKQLRQTCNVSEAARSAGIGRRTAYEWHDADPAFAEAWNDAEQEAADRLEREAWRRAVEGTDKPVTFQGVITTTYKEYSDRLMELLLKAHRPEKFKDRVANELSGPGGGPIKTQEVSARDILAGRIAGLAGRKGEDGGA